MSIMPIKVEPIISSVSTGFRIGIMPVDGDAMLAPMHGFSDWPFRSLCSQLGSAMSYTEFVKADFLNHAFERMLPRLTYEETERPVVFRMLRGEQR